MNLREYWEIYVNGSWHGIKSATIFHNICNQIKEDEVHYLIPDKFAFDVFSLNFVTDFFLQIPEFNTYQCPLSKFFQEQVGYKKIRVAGQDWVG